MNAVNRVPLTQVEDLIAPGQPLPFRVLDGQGRLLLAAGHVVSDARQLGALLERGACVEYDDVAAARRARGAPAAGAGGSAMPRQRTWFDRYEAQALELDTLFRSPQRDAAQIEAFAAAFQTMVERNPDAALFKVLRQDDKKLAQYSFTHALHTATIALVSAQQLNWPATKTGCLVRAALTMNASIGELQGRMAEQREPPTSKQIERIRAHPHASAQLLREAGVSDAAWLATVEDHHERTDGSGYPRALREVAELAQVLRAADVFAAKISPRLLRPALTPQLAARQLFQQEQGGPLAAALIRAVGVYPPGEIVKLKNGETAVVVQRASAGGAAVQVAVLAAPTGKVVLGAPRRDTAQPEFAISGVAADRSALPRVLPEIVFGLIE